MNKTNIAPGYTTYRGVVIDKPTADGFRRIERNFKNCEMWRTAHKHIEAMIRLLDTVGAAEYAPLYDSLVADYGLGESKEEIIFQQFKRDIKERFAYHGELLPQYWRSVVARLSKEAGDE